MEAVCRIKEYERTKEYKKKVITDCAVRCNRFLSTVPTGGKTYLLILILFLGDRMEVSMKKMNLKIKRMLSLLVAMVMVLSMGVFSFAASNDPNMTNDSSQWTLKVAPGQTVTLFASPANNNYVPTGFDSTVPEDSDLVSWTSGNKNIADVTGYGFDTVTATDNVKSLTGLYCAWADVKVPTTATVGSCSIEAKNTTNGSSVNFTIVVDTTVKESATEVQIYLPNFVKTPLAAGTVGYSTMNFATPMDALAKLKTVDTKFGYDASSGYVQTISYDGKSETAKTEVNGNEYIYYGWNYRVYRDNVKVADSVVMSADAFQLQNKDVVVWYYGNQTQVNNFFKGTLSETIK